MTTTGNDEATDTPSIAGRTSRALRARRADAPEPAPADTADTVDTADAEAVIDEAPSDPRTSLETATATKTSPKTSPTKGKAANGKAKIRSTRRRPARLSVVCAAVTAAAAVYAVIGGGLWWRADDAGGQSPSQVRDAAVLAASQDIIALNTADYRHAAAALTTWKSVSTGALLKEFTTAGTDAVTAIQNAKLVTSATVRDAAVTELDTAKGTASVIASVYLKRQPVTGAATTSRNRFRASLVLHDGTWQLSDLAPVSVQLG